MIAGFSQVIVVILLTVTAINGKMVVADVPNCIGGIKVGFLIELIQT